MNEPAHVGVLESATGLDADAKRLVDWEHAAPAKALL